MSRVKIRENPITYDDAPRNAIIAREDVRVKGVIYKEGEMIPEHLWNPSFLNAALRVGIVYRKEAAS
jgi:hypothetical protein